MKITINAFLVICYAIITSSPAYAEETIVLKVKEGDTITRLAERYLEYSEDWPKLATINRLTDPDKIYPGQYLVIPVEILKGVPVDGIVSHLKGTAEIFDQAGDAPRALKINDVINQGEKLLTGSDSALEISYPDGVLIYIGQETEIKIAKTVVKKNDNKVYEFTLGVGKIFNQIKRKTGKDIRYKVTTPTAVAATRGTEFRVGVDQESSTRIEVLDGSIGMKAGKEVSEIQSGYGAVMKKGMKKALKKKLLQPPMLTEAQDLYRSLPVRLSFQADPDVAFIHVILARDPELKNRILDKYQNADTALEVIDIEDGTYFLGARSVDQHNLEGRTSQPVAIRVRINPLPPLIQVPEPMAQIKDDSAELQWLRVPDAENYQLQIAADRNFENIVVDEPGLTNETYETGQLPYQPYFYRIRSIAADGYEGVWTDTRRFTLIPPPPVPAVEEPETSKSTIHLRWKDVGPDIVYRFQLSKSVDFKEPLIDENTDAAEFTFERPEQPGTYYVRIMSIDADGYHGAFSTPQSFEVKGGYAVTTAVIVTWLALIAIAL